MAVEKLMFSPEILFEFNHCIEIAEADTFTKSKGLCSS